MNNKHRELTKRGSTYFLRMVVAGMGAVAILLAGLILPELYLGWHNAFPDFMYLQYPFMTGLVASMVPFFAALYQTLKLLGYVDSNTAFSEKSVRALSVIKHCAFVFGTLFAALLPIFYIIGESDDAPGIIVIGMVMTFAPVVIAVFAAVLQRLLENAIVIKSENDLTV